MLWVYQNNVFLNYSDFSYNEGWSDFLLLELRMKKLIVRRFSDEKTSKEAVLKEESSRRRLIE